MTEVTEDLKNLELDCCDIFKDVKYYITGEVEKNVLELLRNGGAERMNYFSDYVTHLVCGDEPEDTDLSDAVEVYEIPAVTVKWVIYSSHLKRPLSTKPYLYNINKLFSNLNFCFSNIGRDYNVLWAIITYHGGNVQLNLDKNCNYLVTTSTISEKYLKASSLDSESIHIVTPDWVIESVRCKNFAPVEIYHPRLILWPKVVKHESTTSITGFEPDELNIGEANLDNILPDSTQALLEELKQRMPWNQPQTSPSSEVAPPNVVAPNYTSSKLPQQLQEISQQQTVQQRLFSSTQQQLNIQKQTSQSQQQLNFLPSTSQVPRSIVHHPPQSPIQQSNQQLQFPTNQQQQPQQIAFPQAAQRFRIIEHVQNRVQRLQQQQQSQFSQFQQQQRVQQLQQASQLQQEGQMGQVNQQQQVVNQQLRQPQSQQQQNQQQLISTNQSQENQRQLLQNIQQQGQQQQLIQTQQLRQAQSQQVTSMAQLQMAQNQQQQSQQHSNLNQLTKSTPASIQQQHLSPQQLLQRQIQNQHLLKSQHILQNQQQQLQNQLNQQQQNQQGQTQQNQLGQQLLQTQQSQDQLQQSHLEQQLTQQTQLNQPQQQLNQRQLNQLNQHLLQNQLAQQNQQTQLNQQQQLRQNQINAQQQQLQNRLNIQQQQQQNKILQSPFGQPQAPQQQIINQQTVVVSQNQQNVLQQQFGSPNSQQFTQQQTFVQQQPGFNQPQPQPQLIQAQQGQQQVIACQQQQQVQVQQQQQPVQQQQLLAQQQLKPQQIIGQPQLVNQKLNIQQIGGQQHILLQQQQSQQVQGTQESPQRPSNHVWQQQQVQQVPPPAPTPQPQQTQINIQRHPNIQAQGPRVQWAPNQQSGVVLPQRQYIHLDEQTHQQLQQMSPEDRALFVQKLHKHRVLQSRMQAQQQQRAGHILIRSGVPIGLNSQQQMQWLQQQAKQQGVVLQQNISQGAIVQQATPNIQHGAPGLSPIQQQTQFTEQTQQLQLQRQQQQQLRLQQLQLHQQQQREQAQKTVLQQQQPPPALPQPSQPTVVRALVQGPVVDNAGVVAGPPPVVVDPNVVQSQNPLVVNSKTKTALANMLNTRLQSGGSTLSENIAEPSAAGTLKLMNAQHNAALNTGNRPQDLLFFQQRRIINRPNGEVIRPPQAQSVPPGPQVEPPKLQFTPRNSVPLQHRPVPPDLFLLGCVFVVVELERFLDESMPGWQKKIEKHGGEIEKQYCNRVTHVICETQRHGVVMQALRDFKRCVTLYWLSDVINRKQVLPPWIALHLPTMYWDTAPASKHLICLTGFQGTERDRVKHMIKYIGAGLTTYFSKHNTLLITTKPEGRKYSHAKKWGIPIVNVQWLTDIMLGHFTALNQTEHVKYQHFADPANFSFDPLLVPNLMHAWKMPINISQESYEKVKRSASPVVMPPNSKPKKIKTEQIPVTDENDNEEDPILQSTATHRVLFSMCSDVDDLKKIVRQLGGVVAKSFRDSTHLVMPQLKRTHKLLCCICVSTYILPDSWLRDSYAAGKFLDESNYLLDTKEFNSEFKCDFNQTLATKNRSRLFEGKHFFITPSVVPRKKELIELAESCGGIIERNRRTLAQIEATNSSSPYSYVILTHENDLHLVADLLKNKKDKVRIVCNSELILSAVLKQTFEVEPYAVKFL